MKKSMFVRVIAALVLSLLMAGCGAQSGAAKPALSPAPSAAAETAAPQGPETANGSGILIVWFSATGTTSGIANRIAQQLSADTYEIVPESPYTEADLNYMDSNSRTSLEQTDGSSRPVIYGELPDLEPYDTIILGYPIWHGQAPKIIYTFVESCDLAGKTVYPFCTSGSSGIGSSAENLSMLAEDTTWAAGTRFAADVSDDEITRWLDGIMADGQ